MTNRLQIKHADEILNFIIEFSNKNYFMPTMKEIAKGLNIASDSTVCYAMKYLEREGYIKTIPNKARAIIVLESEYHGGKKISE
jgi:repressor LexA